MDTCRAERPSLHLGLTYALQVQAGSLVSQTAAAELGPPAAAADKSPAWEAPLPDNDAERVAVLHALDMADRPMPPESQQIVELVAHICEVSTQVNSFCHQLNGQGYATATLMFCHQPAENSLCQSSCRLQKPAANAAAHAAETQSI